MLMRLGLVGFLGGLAVSSFSKTLALLFGLLVFGVQVRIISSQQGSRRSWS